VLLLSPSRRVLGKYITSSFTSIMLLIAVWHIQLTRRPYIDLESLYIGASFYLFLGYWTTAFQAQWLFNDVLSTYRLCIVGRQRDWTISWAGCGRKQSWPILIYYPSIFLEKVRINTRTEVTIAEVLAEIRNLDFRHTKPSAFYLIAMFCDLNGKGRGLFQDSLLPRHSKTEIE
jgi:hypothetical protein